MMIGPLISVLLFSTALVSTVAYLRIEEIDREQEAVNRDSNFALQNLKLRVMDRIAQITRIGDDVYRTKDLDEFQFQSAVLTSQFPELLGVALLDSESGLRSLYVSSQASASQLRQPTALLRNINPDDMGMIWRERQAVFAPPVAPRPIIGTDIGVYTVLAYVPIFDGLKLVQVLIAEFNLDTLLHFSLPRELSGRYAILMADSSGNTVAGRWPESPSRLRELLPWVSPPPTARVGLAPISGDLYLWLRGYRTSADFLGTFLQWAVGGLSLLTLWMLVNNWRHARRRLSTQRALMDETFFRRAMEDSMLTGMRAMDMQGRITYVNPAFCRMTGWSEAELVGQHPPFSFWAEEDHAMLLERLASELKGIVNHSGFEVRLRRRSGDTFFARMYMSPLVSHNGDQTGWMASITDITEPKKTREELAAAHERFTIVLEGLDAAVSVANLGGNALLFGNAKYRHWYGDDVSGHHRMVMHAQMGLLREDRNDTVDDLSGIPTDTLLEASTEDTNVFDETLGIWLEVRSRYITWVDGSLAQVVIATDVTARYEAEEEAQKQAEKAQAASRLITMGEMASSVAHELNQPLAAISNYCSGMISRLQRQQLEPDVLLSALEKTAKQAQRAGQIISRIRTFVKRSEPSVSSTKVSEIVSDALELAQIELRRQDVRLNYYMAARIPNVMADPILIEQVLINLIKNGAESVSHAKRPYNQREVELSVRPTEVDGQKVVEFQVRDTGTGIPDDIKERIYDAFYSTKSEGMGIGLKLCRSIVESHHGRMNVENIYNGPTIIGCCFSFWIPVSLTPEPRETPAEPISPVDQE
ncbi:MAG: Sensor protein FixL [Pseudomonadota bacterium]